ncbi:MAG: tRNA (N6-isopentenyl adenosine(37)-C2)-methylthiotransferase MiaB [Acidobacteria bacterium]|nr:MAG: tRNA (N6-isopentenyl adenosine(37)-C2)-methylthiotransferase MiaB [Acidobacteriota bacterium]
MSNDLFPILSGSDHCAADAKGQSASSVGYTAAGKPFYIETFGCQMNVHDSEKVAGVLMARGYRPVSTPDDAEIIFYNTCSIREKAAQKVFSRLGTFRKGYAGSRKVFGVLGCVAQQEAENIFERAPHVSLVCGSASYPKLPDLLAKLETGHHRVTGLDLDTEDCFETEMTRRDNRFRAYITIIEGCDKACSYCVVPTTRGPERSRPADKILAETRLLAAEGFTEIQLLGQTVNSYADPSAMRASFAELLSRVAETPGIRRVRFTTSHPSDFTREIVDAIDRQPVLCDQIHLPVQSGSNQILKRMLRTYTREEYLEKIHCIRNAKRAISISTDIIVGFCGETIDDFEQTISLLDEVGYDQVFSFKYSPRPKTPASNLEDSVPEEEKGRRLMVLQEKQRQIQIQRNQECIGKEYEVLVEGFHPRLGQVVGRTTSNRVVNFAGESSWVGQYMMVRVTASGPNSLVGQRVGAPAAGRGNDGMLFSDEQPGPFA